jgi:hypothetical protein
VLGWAGAYLLRLQRPLPRLGPIGLGLLVVAGNVLAMAFNTHCSGVLRID